MGKSQTLETSREGRISPDLSVNLDVPLHQNESDLTLGKGILEAVSDENDEWEALPELVGTRRRSGGLTLMQLIDGTTRAGREFKNTYKGATHLVQHPMAGGGQPLQVFLWSTRLTLEEGRVTKRAII